jgi:hypothetical protein
VRQGARPAKKRRSAAVLKTKIFPRGTQLSCTLRNHAGGLINCSQVQHGQNGSQQEHNRRVSEGNLTFLPREIAMLPSSFPIAPKFVRGAFAVVLLAAAPVAAHAEAITTTPGAADSFAYKGVNYSYTTETKGAEKIVRGTAYAGKMPFELHIRKKSVEGTFNDRPVSFSLNDVKKMGITVEEK